MPDLLSTYSEIRECDYKDRHYSVRDNGAIYRHAKQGKQATKLDNIWTFGNKDNNTGYMMYGGVRVHQIVATAFHGGPEEPNMVVDHKDTNRCNNRPENLHWVTKLENLLNNPYTRKRIILCCGSIETFLSNPSILRESAADPNFKWMRTVSKEEAAKCMKNLDRWAAEDSFQKPKGKGVGEWVFQDRNLDLGETWDKDWYTSDDRPAYQRQKEAIQEMEWKHEEEALALKDSLTQGAKQLNWKIPTAFPLCPPQHGDKPLDDYLANIHKGDIFCKNDIYQSIVYKAEISDDGNTLAVITTSDHIKGVEGYALSAITFQDDCYIHKNEGSFHFEDGAGKYFTIALGREWTGGDVFDDYC